MTEAALGDARYRKSDPSYWGELNAQAATSLEAGHSEEAIIHETWQRLSTLSLDSVDRIRYRGLGAVTCSTVRTLADETLQGAFVEQTAQVMVDNHDWYCQHPPGDMPESLNSKRGLYFGELVNIPTEGVLDELPAVRASYENLPLSTRLLTNTAIVAAKYGFTKRLLELEDHHVSKIVDRSLALESVARDFTSGASMVMVTEMSRRYAQNRQLNLADEPRRWADDKGLLIKDAVSCQQLRSLDVQKAAKLAAGLRLDEVQMDELYQLTRTDCSDGIYIDPRDIPCPPAAVDRARHTYNTLPHDNRLQCPARPVDGAIALATKLTGRIIAETQHELLGPRHRILEKLHLLR